MSRFSAADSMSRCKEQYASGTVFMFGWGILTTVLDQMEAKSSESFKILP
ncbi:hypothetical protein Bca101_037895 [Brassica carinata]